MLPIPRHAGCGVWRRLTVLAAVACVLCGALVRGQEPAPFVRRSSAPLPLSTDRRIIRQQRVDVAAPVLLADVNRSLVLQLDLFVDVTFRALRTRLDATVGGTSWTGVLEGYPGSSVAFAIVGNTLVGHVTSPFGVFNIEQAPDGGYIVQQIDESALSLGEQDARVSPPDPNVSAPRAATTRAVDSGAVLDLMVLYSQDALAGWGSEARARATIDVLVADTNQALRVSGAATSVRLVHAGVVSYEETGDSSVDISRLRSATDGFLDEVHPLRDLHAADTVMLVTELLDPAACGRAYVLGARSLATSAFSWVGRRCTATSRPFAHELGHTLGVAHDWYETTISGAFVYSKGYVSIPGRFMDVMAASNLCTDVGVTCARPMRYSNPALTYDGRPTGVPAGTNVSCTPANRDNPECDADAAATISLMAPVVAAFRNSEDALSARQILPGGSKRSPNGRYRLALQTDGNLVLYDDEVGVDLWSTGTEGTVVRQALMQTDGNFVIYDAGGAAIWSTGTQGHQGARLAVQDDGNLVVYRADGLAVWAR